MALQEYLRSDKLEVARPTLLTAKSSKGSTEIKTNLGNGSLFLRGSGANYRIYYSQDDPAAPRLDPGSYELVGYRIRRLGKQKEPWFSSTTAPSGQKLLVRQGLPTVVKIDPDIRAKVVTRTKGDSVALQLTLRDWQGAPLTIYKDGKRINFPYEIRNSSDKPVASGNLAYG